MTQETPRPPRHLLEPPPGIDVMLSRIPEYGSDAARSFFRDMDHQKVLDLHERIQEVLRGSSRGEAAQALSLAVAGAFDRMTTRAGRDAIFSGFVWLSAFYLIDLDTESRMGPTP